MIDGMIANKLRGTDIIIANRTLSYKYQEARKTQAQILFYGNTTNKS